MAENNKPAACFNCKVESNSSDSLINGWRRHNGEYAKLCHTCHTLYKTRHFCETFHSGEDGWRDCNYCGKLIHCGCIVSLTDYAMEDVGGIICVDCSILAQKAAPDAESHAQDLEMQSISTPAEPDVVLLFEKVMTATDAKHRNSRITIPVKPAKAYFPEVSHGDQGVMLSILDTDGKEWRLDYYCWVQGDHKTHVLHGLKNFMISKNAQPGNTVAFYMRKSDGKMIIELKKTSSAVRTRKASTRKK